jgi:hypothetical protein
LLNFGNTPEAQGLLHRLLRTCRVVKGDRRAAENGNEFAPVHIDCLVEVATSSVL